MRNFYNNKDSYTPQKIIATDEAVKELFTIYFENKTWNNDIGKDSIEYSSCKRCWGEGKTQFKECEECGGIGNVDTFSKYGNRYYNACKHCNGYGEEYDDDAEEIVCNICDGSGADDIEFKEYGKIAMCDGIFDFNKTQYGITKMNSRDILCLKQNDLFAFCYLFS